MVPATAATMATAGPVTVRWNLTDLMELDVLKGDKRNLLSGATEALGFHPVARTALNAGRQRADLSQVQGEVATRWQPSRTQGAVGRILCPMLDLMALEIDNKTV